MVVSSDAQSGCEVIACDTSSWAGSRPGAITRCVKSLEVKIPRICWFIGSSSTTITALDALDELSAAFLRTGDQSELLDLCVQALTKLYDRCVMLHGDGSGLWIGPRGALLGRTDRLNVVAQSSASDIFAPCGEAYEDDLGRPPVVVLLPLSRQVVVALGWNDDRVQARPMAAMLIHRLYRIACVNYNVEVSS